MINLKRLRRFLRSLKAKLTFNADITVHGSFYVSNPSKVTFGDGCSVNKDVHITSINSVVIGNRVTLSARCMLIDSGLALDGNEGERVHLGDQITIEDGVWIGAAAIILPGVTIGKNSVVGAGSVVTKSLPESVIAAGNPAKIIRKIDSLS